MNISRARELLGAAGAETDRLRRHLLVAAALNEAMVHRPVVVGGTAEEYWSADEYHDTDLDLCGVVTEADRKTLQNLGFQKKGRFWFREGLNVVFEFPSPAIQGDEGRIRTETISGGEVKVIGLDDLYLDRLRQATTNESQKDIHYHSALAIAVSRYEEIDWKYVANEIDAATRSSQIVGAAMRRVNSRIRRQVRRALVEG